jgi:hypothetical protein
MVVIGYWLNVAGSDIFLFIAERNIIFPLFLKRAVFKFPGEKTASQATGHKQVTFSIPHAKPWRFITG